LMNYYVRSKLKYGPEAKDGRCRGQMVQGICEAGETVFIPSGWWHLVVNLETSIAVTQNFVGRNELAQVLDFMIRRPDQLSGFSRVLDRDDGGPGIFRAFCHGLRAAGYDSILDEALLSILPKSQVAPKSTWREGGDQPFTFGFDVEE